MSLAGLIALLEATKYPLFFAGSFLEGTGVMLTGGVFLHLGLVAFWPVYLALIAGDIISDIMWYYVGYFGARRFLMRWGHLIGATPDIVAKIERRFHKYHLHILVTSKLTMGFGLATPILTTAGMLRVPFSRYFAINAGLSFVWVGLVMVVGYFFGNVLSLVPKDLQLFAVPVMIVLFFVLIKVVTKRLAEVDW